MENNGMGGKRTTDNARSGVPRRPALLALVWLLLAGLLGARGVAPAGTCPPVQNTLKYTIVYGDVTVNGQPAAVGTVVEARNGDGVVAGCFEVTTAGSYGAMYVYGEDTSVAPPIPGMRSGEVIAFFVKGVEATATPQQTWSNDKAPHPVNLSATSAACPYDFNTTPGVDIGDVQLIAGAWRARDAGSLARYDFNHNNVVDIGDIMPVAAHLGEPCP